MAGSSMKYPPLPKKTSVSWSFEWDTALLFKICVWPPFSVYHYIMVLVTFEKYSVFHMTCYSFFAQAQHTFLMTENQCQPLRTGNLLFIYYSKWWKSTRVASSGKRKVFCHPTGCYFSMKKIYDCCIFTSTVVLPFSHATFPLAFCFVGFLCISKRESLNQKNSPRKIGFHTVWKSLKKVSFFELEKFKSFHLEIDMEIIHFT